MYSSFGEGIPHHSEASEPTMTLGSASGSPSGRTEMSQTRELLTSLL